MASDQKKWPYISWFVSDWLGDPKVSLCEPETRGILFDWLCNMHALDRSGQVTGTRELLARIGRCTVLQCDAALADLKQTNAAEIQERNGVVTVINRRMKREFLARKNGAVRVSEWRGKTTCNAPVTGHTIPIPISIPKGDSQGLTSKPSTEGGVGETVWTPFRIPTPREAEILALGEAVLNGQWTANAQFWGNRIMGSAEIKAEPGKVERILRAVAEAEKNGEIRTTKAQAAMFFWKTWK